MRGKSQQTTYSVGRHSRAKSDRKRERFSDVLRALALAVAGAACYFTGTGEAPSLPPAQALALDSSSPWRWCDLCEDLFSQGDAAKAAYCMHRALQLAPHIPSIWVRVANLAYQAGDTPKALSCWAHALNAVPIFDDVVFSYFDQLREDPLPELGDRARQSYFVHLLANSRFERAEKAWPRIRQTDALAVQYSSTLAGHGMSRQAAAVWARYTHAPLRLIYNGGFEDEPRGGPFDWTIARIDGVEAVRDSSQAYAGKWSLRITFAGESNLDFEHVWEKAYVSGGRYRFRAMVKTRNLTTDQGIRFAVGPVLTDAVGGTRDWTPLEAEINLPPGLVAVVVRRKVSTKFDYKISGTVWVDAISLDQL